MPPDRDIEFVIVLKPSTTPNAGGVGEVGVTLSLRVRSSSCLRCEPTQERGDGRRPSHSLPCCWLEFCDAISQKSNTGGGDPTDRAHDGGIGTRSSDVAFLHRLTDRHHQQPFQSPWPLT
jgi:hypothetical protein